MSGYAVANPALEHVQHRMKHVSEPVLHIYPSALSDNATMAPFGRLTSSIVGGIGPRILLALDHPAFVDNRLEDLQKAYAHRVTLEAAPGTPVVLCYPSKNSLRRWEIVEPTEANKLPELPPEKLHVSGSLHATGTSMYDRDLQVWSTDTVERSDAFGGWPCVLLMPTTAARLLALDVALMWPSDVPHEVVREASFFYGEQAARPAVRFERNGQPVDDECSAKQLGMWAEAGEQIEVVVDGTRVPLRFDAAYAREGQFAAHAELDARRGTDQFFTVAAVGVVGLLGLMFWHKSKGNLP